MWNAKSKPMILPIGMYSRCKQKEILNTIQILTTAAAAQKQNICNDNIKWKLRYSSFLRLLSENMHTEQAKHKAI